MAWNVRLATPADTAALPEIERSAGESFLTLPKLAWIASDEVSSPEALLPLIAQRTVWVAVEDGDEPRGFLSAERLASDLHIWEIAVARPYQQRGIGAGLMAAAEQAACVAGLEALTLTTFRDVVWNAPFYARLGFSVLDRPGPRLAAVLAAEAERGLPGRCAMRKPL